jgi:histidyl-tRNA synthetase
MSKARSLAKLPGFRDFPPGELALRNHLFDAWRRVSRRYGFREYDGPPLESLELYTRKSGAEIVGQLYDFVDKGDRHVSLRPEMTPSLARILGERSRAMPKPIRWFSIPQLFRYERQQRGRLREHFQWNVDLVGEGGLAADAEVLAVALDGLQELGLGVEDIRARVSDRVLLTHVLRAGGVKDESMEAAYSIIDKIEREPAEKILQRLQDPDQVGLGEAGAERILRLFDTPTLEAVTSEFSGSRDVVDRAAEVSGFLEMMAELGFAEFVDFDFTIVRGLAYYTGIVFEIFDRKGEFRAICGGGRYDHLLELVGGEPLPAAGFGMGDVVLSELLAERGLLPDFEDFVDTFIVTVTPAQEALARHIASAMRRNGRSVTYALRNQSVRKQLSSAAQAGAREAVILGPDETARGVAVIRSMSGGEEREVPLDVLVQAGSLPAGGVAGIESGPGSD